MEHLIVAEAAINYHLHRGFHSNEKNLEALSVSDSFTITIVHNREGDKSSLFYVNPISNLQLLNTGDQLFLAKVD